MARKAKKERNTKTTSVFCYLNNKLSFCPQHITVWHKLNPVRLILQSNGPSEVTGTTCTTFSLSPALRLHQLPSNTAGKIRLIKLKPHHQRDEGFQWESLSYCLGSCTHQASRTCKRLVTRNGLLSYKCLINSIRTRILNHSLIVLSGLDMCTNLSSSCSNSFQLLLILKCNSEKKMSCVTLMENSGSGKSLLFPLENS